MRRIVAGYTVLIIMFSVEKMYIRIYILPTENITDNRLEFS